MKNLSRNWRLAAALLVLPLTTVKAVDIEPPKAQVVDRYGINMTNGQVSQSLGTVSIGGAMGLSHSISVDANEFNYSGYRGFRDKFFGRARNITNSTDPYFSPQNVLRVSDSTDTVDFMYYVGSTRQESGWGLTSGYTYVAHGDERQILEYDSSYLYWTKPDGTVVRFARASSPTAASSALLVDITYPTGFRIDIWSGGMSVSTNTGFQLKSIYVADNRPLDKPDKPYLENAPPADSASWALSNPKYIKGINSAIEYCAATATSCTLTNTWPTATFNWPAGMPRTMFLGDSSASVVDSLGKTTTYTYRAYDLAYVELQGGAVASGQTLDRRYSPRLIGVTTTGAPRQHTYNYRNVYQGIGGSDGAWDIELQTSGVVITATRQTQSAAYDFLGRYFGDLNNLAYGNGGIDRVQVHANTPEAKAAIYFAQTEEGTATYENSARNFLSRFEPAFGPRQDLLYERGNLKRITYQQHIPSESTYIEATFPTSCTVATRKTCNQATSMRDARGFVTSYTYHQSSGQVESVRRPADDHGVYPETHYQYQQLSAHYYSPTTGAWITGSPIWMKTTERHCINSNYSSRLPSATCALNDEVITQYEYNHNNLLMTGMTVTAPNEGTLRTCFRYDIYGNQIGRTEPKANLSSCS